MLRPKKKGDVFFPARKAQDVRREEEVLSPPSQISFVDKIEATIISLGR
jgi:hypothetical protein